VDWSYFPNHLYRWDPGVGLTYMNSQSPMPVASMPYTPTDVLCGDRIMMVGGVGSLYERQISGTNAWVNWGRPVGFLGEAWLVGTPAVSVDVGANPRTYVAVRDNSYGRVYILEDACGSPTWSTAGDTGNPVTAGYPGDDWSNYAIDVGGGMTGGKFFLTAGNWNNSDIVLWETYYNAAIDQWLWVDHGRPVWASDIVGTPVAVTDSMVLVLATDQYRGRLVLTALYWDYRTGWQWVPNGVWPPNDDIEPGSLTAEFGVFRCVVKGTSGRFWSWSAGVGGMQWFDLGAP
jgi:hypothetical protein